MGDFEIVKAVLMKIQVSLDVMLYQLIKVSSF
jgi:hypothetical protein